MGLNVMPVIVIVRNKSCSSGPVIPVGISYDFPMYTKQFSYVLPYGLFPNRYKAKLKTRPAINAKTSEWYFLVFRIPAWFRPFYSEKQPALLQKEAQ